MALISRGPERYRLFSQKRGGLLDRYIELPGKILEGLGILNGFSDEFLRQHYISPGL